MVDKHRSKHVLPTYRVAVARWRARWWRGFKSPEGVVYGPILNLAAFCREMGLQANNLRLVEYGGQKSSKGWTKPDDFEMMSAIPWKEHALEYFLESPVGKVYGPLSKSADLRKVCKEAGLAFSMVTRLLRGEIKEYQGWTLQVLED